MPPISSLLRSIWMLCGAAGRRGSEKPPLRERAAASIKPITWPAQQGSGLRPKRLPTPTPFPPHRRHDARGADDGHGAPDEVERAPLADPRAGVHPRQPQRHVHLLRRHATTRRGSRLSVGQKGRACGAAPLGSLRPWMRGRAFTTASGGARMNVTFSTMSVTAFLWICAAGDRAGPFLIEALSHAHAPAVPARLRGVWRPGGAPASAAPQSSRRRSRPPSSAVGAGARDGRVELPRALGIDLGAIAYWEPC